MGVIVHTVYLSLQQEPPGLVAERAGLLCHMLERVAHAGAQVRGEAARQVECGAAGRGVHQQLADAPHVLVVVKGAVCHPDVEQEDGVLRVGLVEGAAQEVGQQRAHERREMAQAVHLEVDGTDDMLGGALLAPAPGDLSAHQGRAHVRRLDHIVPAKVIGAPECPQAGQDGARAQHAGPADHMGAAVGLVPVQVQGLAQPGRVARGLGPHPRVLLVALQEREGA